MPPSLALKVPYFMAGVPKLLSTDSIVQPPDEMKIIFYTTKLIYYLYHLKLYTVFSKYVRSPVKYL